MTEVPDECTPDEVAFTVHWKAVDDETLTGVVIARNVSGRTWRISGKPELQLLAASGSTLPADHVVSLEGMYPDWQVVAPGRAASAEVSTSFWDGTELADHVLVGWNGGTKTATVDGPTHPARRYADSQHGMMTSSYWFRPYEED